MTDGMNVTCLSIHDYFINVIIAMNCMGENDYELDTVRYTVENMDTDIVAEIESSYAGHLGQRARDQVTQNLATQQFLIHATNAEKKVNNTRNLISARTTKILSVILGFAAAATTVAAADGQVVSALAYVAEKTIHNKTPIPEFTWVHGRCHGCNSQSHMYKTKGKITYTEVGRPNVIEYVLKNLATLSSTTRKPRHLREGDGKWAKNGQFSKPEFSMMVDHQKKAFAKALVTNSGSVKKFKQYIKKAKLAKEGDESDDGVNITCLPNIVVLNSDVGASPPLPAKLDGNLSDIKFLVVRENTKGVSLTALWSLIDSGAGATIGFLNYFEGVLIINPDALVRIFTSSGGEYSSIFMHGIVSTDTEGVTTTELPVAFHIRTPYRCRDG